MSKYNYYLYRYPTSSTCEVLVKTKTKRYYYNDLRHDVWMPIQDVEKRQLPYLTNPSAKALKRWRGDDVLIANQNTFEAQKKTVASFQKMFEVQS